MQINLTTNSSILAVNMPNLDSTSLTPLTGDETEELIKVGNNINTDSTSDEAVIEAENERIKREANLEGVVTRLSKLSLHARVRQQICIYGVCNDEACAPETRYLR